MILDELKELFISLGLPSHVGVFLATLKPSAYVVLTPLIDDYPLYGDDKPVIETQDVRLSLFDKENYQKSKNEIIASLVDADFTIRGRRYVGYEHNTQYHHYAIDVAKYYPTNF